MPPIAFRKTRLAPTPSGYLHAGNAVNVLLTAALAQQAGAALLLRIDDLDRDRFRPVYLHDVFDTLDYLHIHCTDGPSNAADFEARWSQRHRRPLYEAALEKLLAKHCLYACACTRTQLATGAPCHCPAKALPFDRPDVSWRLLTNQQPLAVHNAFGQPQQATLPAALQNFVVRRKDGVPAYQLASVVDDLQFGVDFIVRGQDLWPSTLAQLFLATQLEETAFLQTRFLHHPLLTNAEGAKLSKTEGAAAVKRWREEGKDRQELLTAVAKQLGLKTDDATPAALVAWALRLQNG